MKKQVIKISGVLMTIIVFAILNTGKVSAVQAPPSSSECTSWTYSEWSVCQSDGTQTRTIISSSPEDCIGGEPVSEQSCTPSPTCTDGHFCDTEDSTENGMVAGTLDFSLISPSDFLPSPVLKGGTTTRNITVNNDRDLDFKYDAGVMQTGGDTLLCNSLMLKVAKGSDVLYNNYLMSFLLPEITNSGTSDSLSFEVTLPSGVDDSLQGEICQFRLDFDAWQTNLSYGQGFEDEEELDNQISAGYWNPPVVLNEFLPNAGEYPEFIELYNQTGSVIDLKDFYIKADSNEILINSTTTNTYSGGLTTIAAHGWLVVTAVGDLMNNTSGTITLYNPNDVMVDTYTYDAADNNVNNNPGWTNNLVAYWPFQGNANDLSGNSNNGTVNGPIFVGGKINQGLSFDGTNDYVQVANSSSLGITNEITIETWINPDIVIKPYYHSSIVDRGNSYWFFISNTGKLTFLRFNQSDPDTGWGRFSLLSTSVNISTGIWTHIVATYSVSGGNAVKLYINGQLSASGNFANGPIDNPNSNLTIGNRMGQHYFDGSIDEVKIYNRTLSDSEVFDHYNAVGTGGTVPTDKSYARIPDGSSHWVDPIPTPGAPNEIEQVVLEIDEDSMTVVSDQPTENSESTEPIIIEPVAEETEIQTSVEENSSSTEEVIVEEPAVLPEDDNEIIEGQQENTDSEETVPEQATETQDTEPVAEEIQEPVVLEQTTAETVIENIVPESTTDQQTVAEQITVAEPIQETISQ